ncbi:MAG: DUF4856 domain-containing protein [Myxococcota bacterium]
MKTTFYANGLAALLALTACGDDGDGGGEGAGDAGTAADDGTGTDDGGTGDDAGSDDVGDADDDGSGDDSNADVPEIYEFESRFGDGSSVSHGGQTTRHLLIAELKDFIGGLDDAAYVGAAAGDVVADLNFWYDFKNNGGEAGEPILFAPSGAELLQTTFGEVGSVASVKEKIADIESVAAWEGGVAGWGDGSTAPSALVDIWFEELEALVLARSNDANIPTNPDGQDIAEPYVTAEGIDYQQLIQKFLLGAVAFSQAADKYMDDDKDGQGLLSDNTMAKDDKPYSALEHVWDEGYGYFGGARDYVDYTDDDIADNGFADTDGDSKIDLKKEICWGASVNAAKRDRGATAGTDFTKDAFDAFLLGRHLIATAGGDLSEAQLDELKGYRDTALGAWEKAIAATIVHYINDTLKDMGAFGSGDYSFADHAKHFSEMKGFALSLQFNKNHSPMSPADLAELHQLIRDRPVLPGASDIEAYAADLNAAKDILQSTYDFDAANMGDADGNDGW